MKRLLIFVLICVMLVGFNELKSFADYPSPQVTEHDIRVRYFPDIATNLYRVCDSTGKLIRFIDFQDISFEIMDDLTDAYPGDRFVFKITINIELAEGEYIELIILDNYDLTVYINDTLTKVDKIGEYNIIHVTESGIIRIR